MITDYRRKPIRNPVCLTAQLRHHARVGLHTMGETMTYIKTAEAIASFLRLLPTPHMSVSIEHNDHKHSYVKPSKYFEQNDIDDHGLLADELAACDAQDELWCVRCYPHTPVGFHCGFGLTLEMALQRCLSDNQT